MKMDTLVVIVLLQCKCKYNTCVTRLTAGSKSWNDSRLTWKPSQYGDIQYLFETEGVFWRPMLFIDNSVGSMKMITDPDLLIRAKSTGEMLWEPPAIYHTHCEIITTYYPFDVQHCYIELVSWAYTIDDVSLIHMASAINLEDYRINGEWELISTSLKTNKLIDGQETFAQLQFIIKVRRRSMFYVLNVMLPIMLTSFLSILIFVLPHDSGEKVSYSLTVLLAYAVLLTLISDNMPSTSHNVSILSIYLSLILFLGALAVLLAVLSLHLYHQPPHKPIPRWIRNVVIGLMLKITSYDINTERGEKTPKAFKTSGPRKKIHPLEDEHMSNKMEHKTKETTAEFWSNGDAGDRYTWVNLANIFDAFFYRLFAVTVVLVTLICLLVLIIGEYLQH